MRRGSIVGAVLALAVAGVMVMTQPVGAGWWHAADPDGAYVGNGLNILLGNHTHYLDHPGLPTQDALALGFGAEYLIRKATGAADDRVSFVDRKMLDLDEARPLYRAWALVLFSGAGLLVYCLVARLLGHWTWGVAGAVLFTSTPGIAPISLILRPDAALAALCLAVGYFAATGFEQRSAPRYSAAALLLGLHLLLVPGRGPPLPRRRGIHRSCPELSLSLPLEPHVRFGDGPSSRVLRRRLRRPSCRGDADRHRWRGPVRHRETAAALGPERELGVARILESPPPEA